VGHDTHGNEDYQQIDKDGQVCKPTIIPQCADLADEEADNNEYDAANRIAEMKL
jgi:hypothetical protein